MICWELIWGYYRRNWWREGQSPVLGGLWLFSFWLFNPTIAIFLAYFAMCHPLFVEQPCGVYRMLPIARPTLIRTLNLLGLCWDIMAFGPLLLLMDLVQWHAGGAMQHLVLNQLLALSMLLVIRNPAHFWTLRDALRSGLHGNDETETQANSPKYLFALIVTLAVVAGAYLLKDASVTPTWAWGLAASAGLSSWLTCARIQALVTQSAPPHAVRKTAHQATGKKPGNAEWRMVLDGMAASFILLLLSLLFNRQAIELHQGVRQLLSSLLTHVFHASLPIMMGVFCSFPLAFQNLAFMRLLRGLPWNSWQLGLYISRQYIFVDLGFGLPWAIAILIVEPLGDKLIVLTLIGMCILCLQLGALLLSLKTGLAMANMGSKMIPAIILSIIIDAFFRYSDISALGERQSLFLGALVGATMLLAAGLFCAVAQTLRLSSIPYRRQQE
jgi:hypothetical protein